MADLMKNDESSCSPTHPIEVDKASHQGDVDNEYYHDGDDDSSGSDRSAEDGFGGSASDSASKSDQGPRKRRCRLGSHGSSRRRHKGGVRHKKTFQPYPPQEEVKLKRSSQERREKEDAAAVVRREDGGQEFIRFPVAPFNSTQYLMDEHSVNSEDIVKTSKNLNRLTSMSEHAFGSVNSTPSHNNHDVMSNLQRKDEEFVDIYTSVHAESLQSLHKEELVKHYMSLEEKVELLQRELAVVKQKKMRHSQSEVEVSESDKDNNCDSATGSDTNSLSSINEDFIDLSAVNQPTISVGGEESSSNS